MKLLQMRERLCQRKNLKTQYQKLIRSKNQQVKKIDLSKFNKPKKKKEEKRRRSKGDSANKKKRRRISKVGGPSRGANKLVKPQW
jgi:translation initiation factor IF-2